MNFIIIFAIAAAIPSVFADNDTAPEISQVINIPYQGSILQTSEASVSCLNCSVIGAVSFSAGCEDCTLEDINLGPDSNFTTINATFDWNDNWVAVAFDRLVFHVEIAVDLTPTSPTHEIVYSLGKIDFPLKTGSDILSADFNFDAELHGWLNVSQAANLTYGFDVNVPPGSVVFFPVLHPDQIATIGFNQTTITTSNFTSTTPSLNMDFEFSFRPLLSFSASFLSITYSAALYADIPKLDLAIHQVSNVTSTCDPAPASLPSDQIFQNLTHIVPSISYDVIFNNSGSVSEIAEGNVGMTLPTGCYEYFAKSSSLAGPVVGSQNKNEASGVSGATGLFSMVVVGMVFAGL